MVKSCLDFEFDANTLAQCDADLVRCRILARLPSLPNKDGMIPDKDEDGMKGKDKDVMKDEDGNWVNVASTEWKKINRLVLLNINKQICFERIIHIKHSTVKLVVDIMTLDLKRNTQVLGSKTIQVMDQDVYIRNNSAELKGKVKMRNTLFDSSTESFRFKNMNDSWILVNVRDSVIFDGLNTRNTLLNALIDYGDQLIAHWDNYPVSSGYTGLIKESLVTGVKLRIIKCKHWMELKRENSLYEALADINSHVVSTIVWDFSWIKEQSRIFHHSDAANVTHIYIKQAISSLSDILKRKIFAIKDEIKKIELAASTTADNFDIMYQIKSNLYEICTRIIELVSDILIEIDKSQGIPQEWTKDVSALITLIHLDILPNLAQSSTSSQVPFGKILKQVTNAVEELVLRVDRFLKIHLLYLTGTNYDGRLVKRSWWSGLLYEYEFLLLLTTISCLVQKMFLSVHMSAEFTSLLFETGFLFVLYSDMNIDLNNIGIFEDLFYRLQEIRKRIKLRFHLNSNCSDVKVNIGSLYLVMSFPIPDNMQSIMMNQLGNVDIIPLLFISKINTVQTIWGENEQKKEDLSARLMEINDTTFKYLELYLGQLRTFEMSTRKEAYTIGNAMDLSLKLLSSEIKGTEANRYFSRQEFHLTYLANRCINDIGKYLAKKYAKDDQKSIFAGIWMQEYSSKSTFHHEAVDYLYESFGIRIERNWEK